MPLSQVPMSARPQVWLQLFKRCATVEECQPALVQHLGPDGQRRLHLLLHMMETTWELEAAELWQEWDGEAASLRQRLQSMNRSCIAVQLSQLLRGL